MKNNRFDEKEPYVPISEDMADNDLLEEYEAQLAEKKAKQRGEAAPVQPAEPFVRQEAEVPAPPVPPVPERDEPKPPIYKQWWFWLIIAVVIIGIIVAIVVGASKKDDDKTTKASSSTTTSTTVESTTEVTTSATTATTQQTTQEQSTTAGTTAATTEGEDDRDSRYNYALEKARALSELMHLSKQGIYNELVSPGGENLKADAAQYAVDHLKANYKTNAKILAQEYSMEGLNEDEIYNKLVNEDLFTDSEADYAVSHM